MHNAESAYAVNHTDIASKQVKKIDNPLRMSHPTNMSRTLDVDETYDSTGQFSNTLQYGFEKKA